MHKENGYICSAQSKEVPSCLDNEFWFGPKINPGDTWHIAESFMTNGLRSFPNLESAQKAKDELKLKSGFYNVQILSIEMMIAETQNDLEFFKKRKKLVVIQILPTPMAGYEIIGEFKETAHHIGTIPGSLFQTNGRKPFENYSDAEHTAREVRRQGKCQAMIATLRLKKA